MSSTASAENLSDGRKPSLIEASNLIRADIAIEIGTEEIVDLRQPEAQTLVTPVESANEAPSGVRDPVFPVVIIGILALIAILVIAALLAL